MIRRMLAVALATVALGWAHTGHCSGPVLEAAVKPRQSFPGQVSPRIVAEIRGDIIEAWYCPEVEWAWPDGTRSTESSDCEPWSEAAAAEAPRRWSKPVSWGTLHCGDNTITVRLLHNGKLVAAQAAVFTVLGC